MRVALLAVLLVGVLAEAQLPSEVPPSSAVFNIQTLADGNTHCFSAYLKQGVMDPLGIVDPKKPAKQKWPVKYCFMIPADKSFCRWSYEIIGTVTDGTKSFSSWVLHRNADLPVQTGWTTYNWAAVSQDYSESAFKGVDQECALSESSSGGGWISGSLTVWPQRLFLDVIASFTFDGERSDDFPKSSSQNPAPKKAVGKATGSGP